MVRGDVECLEVVPVVFDFGAFFDREPGMAEDRLDTAARAAYRVQAAGLLAATGLRDVDASRGELAFEFQAAQFRLACLEGRTDLVTNRIDAGTRGLAFVRR